jgi:methylenetetrahydrofolate dehydrogenase (NADP+)/methenyltetrahydrofolate cyclohydrolase
MKSLNGKELSEFIKERQAKAVRSLGMRPKLAIVQCIDSPVIDTYVRLKKRYGADIGIDVDIHRVPQAESRELLRSLNADDSVQAIIVQLPLENPDETEDVVNLVAPEKDVDGLGEKAQFDPATPMAILWLLSGYNVDLRGKHVLLIGRGKLVGAPLKRMLEASGVDVEVGHRGTPDLRASALAADVIITATGKPGILLPDMVKEGAVVIDAGTASESGKTVGDVDPELYERDDLTITPQKGGVGPLTVCALFDNVIRAASRTIKPKKK